MQATADKIKIGAGILDLMPLPLSTNGLDRTTSRAGFSLGGYSQKEIKIWTTSASKS